MAPLVDLDGIPEGGGFSPLPAGDYLLKVVEAELKDTKSGKGQYISTKFVVLQGDYEGRYLWDNYNIKNPSAKAEEIGKGQLKGLLIKSGQGGEALEEVDDLVGLEVGAKLIIEDDQFYGEGNKIQYYKKPEEVGAEASDADDSKVPADTPDEVDPDLGF